MKTKLLIILIILVGLGAGGFFVYKNIFAPTVEIPSIVKEKLDCPLECCLDEQYKTKACPTDSVCKENQCIKITAVVPRTGFEADTAAVAKAGEDIEVYRKGDVTLTVVDAQGQPRSGIVVDYTQTKHSFLFGFYNQGYDENAAALMKQAGLNYVTLGMDWESHDESKPWMFYILDYWSGIHLLYQAGFTIMGQSLIWLNEPVDSCNQYPLVP